jgi:hypothetical protein
VLPDHPSAIFTHPPVRDSLYCPDYGYFTSGSGPVLPLDRDKDRFKFSTLSSQHGYQSLVMSAYEKGHGWLTPVELFSPFLSRAIARHIILQHRNQSKPLHIIEIGAGRGQLATDILEYMRRHHDDIFDTMRYTIVEISPNLAAAQREYLQRWIDLQKLVVVSNDATIWLNTDVERTKSDCLQHANPLSVHVIACEVLDNLPHDLIQSRKGALRQAYVSGHKNDTQHRVETQWVSEVESVVLDALLAFRLLRPHGTWMEVLQAALEIFGFLRRLTSFCEPWPTACQVIHVLSSTFQVFQEQFRERMVPSCRGCIKAKHSNIHRCWMRLLGIATLCFQRTSKGWKALFMICNEARTSVARCGHNPTFTRLLPFQPIWRLRHARTDTIQSCRTIAMRKSCLIALALSSNDESSDSLWQSKEVQWVKMNSRFSLRRPMRSASV